MADGTATKFDKDRWYGLALSLVHPLIGLAYTGRRNLLYIVGLPLLVIDGIFFWSFYGSTDLVVLGYWCLIFMGIGYLGTYWIVYKSIQVRNKTSGQGARKPWLPVVLSLLYPGLGQIYLRQFLQAAFWIGIAVLIGLQQEKHGAPMTVVFEFLLAMVTCGSIHRAYTSAAEYKQDRDSRLDILCLLTIFIGVFSMALPMVVFGVKGMSGIRGDGCMHPTLSKGDVVLVKFVPKGGPERGDIVVFSTQENGMLIKRIVALPGEDVEFRDGLCYVDAHALTAEPFKDIHYTQEGEFAREGRPYRVPMDHIFVAGDHSERSNDSRYFGAIPLSDLYGQADKILWPPRRTGPL